MNELLLSKYWSFLHQEEELIIRLNSSKQIMVLSFHNCRALFFWTAHIMMIRLHIQPTYLFICSFKLTWRYLLQALSHSCIRIIIFNEHTLCTTERLICRLTLPQTNEEYMQTKRRRGHRRERKEWGSETGEEPLGSLFSIDYTFFGNTYTNVYRKNIFL